MYFGSYKITLLTVLVEKKNRERSLVMGEEESKLLQVAQITVLRLYTLSPKSFYLVWGQWRLA